MKKAIFLDKDGTLMDNCRPDIYKIVDVSGLSPFERAKKLQRLMPNSIEGLKKLSKHGYKLIIISSQPFLREENFTAKQILEFKQYILNLFKEKKIKIDELLFCPHKKDEVCKCKKPNIELFLKAIKRHNVDLSQSYIIGDETIDLQTGEYLGLNKILVKTGWAGQDKTYDIKPDMIVENINEASGAILKMEKAFGSLNSFLENYKGRRPAEAGVLYFYDPDPRLKKKKRLKGVPHSRVSICLLPFLKRCMNLGIENVFFLERSAAILETAFNMLQDELFKRKIIPKKVHTARMKFRTIAYSFIKPKSLSQQFMLFLTEAEKKEDLDKIKRKNLIKLYQNLSPTKKKELDTYLKNRNTDFGKLILKSRKEIIDAIDVFDMVQLPDLDLHWHKKNWRNYSIKLVLKYMMKGNNHPFRPFYNEILKTTQFSKILNKPIYIVEQSITSAYTAYYGDIILKAFNPSAKYYIGAFYIGLNNANERKGPFMDIGLLVCPKNRNFEEGFYIYDQKKSLIPSMGTFQYERRTDLSGVNYLYYKDKIMRITHKELLIKKLKKIINELGTKEKIANLFFSNLNKKIQKHKLLQLAKKQAKSDLIKNYIDKHDIIRLIFNKLDPSNDTFSEDFVAFSPKPQYVRKIGNSYFDIFSSIFKKKTGFIQALEDLMGSKEFENLKKQFKLCKDYLELAVLYDWINRRNKIIFEMKKGIDKLKEKDYAKIKKYLESKKLRFTPSLLALLK